MRLLLDTNALLRWLSEQSKLSRAAWAAIQGPANEVFVSAASAWEIATTQRIGKLTLSEDAIRSLPEDIEEAGFTFMDISFRQALLAGRLPISLRDPFDRIIIAQAKSENMTVITSDRAFGGSGVSVIW
ncbi:MAG: type II toxin-antitoxin system VapC family toxin [Thermodesulfobacteriota bacterium]